MSINVFDLQKTELEAFFRYISAIDDAKVRKKGNRGIILEAAKENVRIGLKQPTWVLVSEKDLRKLNTKSSLGGHDVRESSEERNEAGSDSFFQARRRRRFPIRRRYPSAAEAQEGSRRIKKDPPHFIARSTRDQALHHECLHIRVFFLHAFRFKCLHWTTTANPLLFFAESARKHFRIDGKDRSNFRIMRLLSRTRFRFMSRSIRGDIHPPNLTLRATATTCQRPPSDSIEKIVSFIMFVRKLREEMKYE